MTFFILALFSLSSSGQADFRVMSYNVENLFDTEDNPLTADNDFLPSGNRHCSNWQKSSPLPANGAPPL